MTKLAQLLLVSISFASCNAASQEARRAALPSGSASATMLIEIASVQDLNQSSGDVSQRHRAITLAESKREYEEALSNHPPKEIPLPNFVQGPGILKPIGVNFYEDRKYYPGYLLCTYDVNQRIYNQTNEPAWLHAALTQIRRTGPRSFPPFKWVAVVIYNNRADGASTFEQLHKVGAIFKLSDVFDPPCDLSQLVAQAKLDRHPFSSDPAQPTPGEQDRWLIVERHAATVGAATNSNEKATRPEPHK
jgi:hypothetical protein